MDKNIYEKPFDEEILTKLDIFQQSMSTIG